jgi:hypothetical protein
LLVAGVIEINFDTDFIIKCFQNRRVYAFIDKFLESDVVGCEIQKGSLGELPQL